MTQARATRPRRWSCARVFGVVFLAFVVIVAGAVVTGKVHRYRSTQQLQASVDAAYATARPQADQRHRAGQAALDEILGPAQLQASSVYCRVDGDDAGLIRVGWSLDCAIRSVDAYRTDLTYPALAKQLQRDSLAHRGDSTILGSPTTDPAPANGCGTLRADSGKTPADPSVTIMRLAAGTFDATEHAAGSSYGCVAPVPVNELTRTRTEKTYADTDLTPQHSWVTVVRSTPVLQVELDCSPLGCHTPAADPVLPRP